MKPTGKQHCLDDLRARILTLDIRPGSDLDEATLSAHYAISRTPLREVLQRLAGEGYVTLESNRGARVASMDLSVMRTFFQTAPMIYSAVGRLAAERHRPQQLDELRAVQEAFSLAVAAGDALAMAMHNHRFHEIIGEMAGNDYLMPSLNRLLIDHARLSQTFYRPAAPAERDAVTKACSQHDDIIQAIADREPAVVVELTRQHWELSRGRMERFVLSDPLPLDATDHMEQSHAV